MPTLKVNLTDAAYTLVAASDKEFLIENASSNNVRLVFASSLPANSTVDYHVLEAGEGVMRFALVGAVYARAEVGTNYLVVSTN